MLTNWIGSLIGGSLHESVAPERQLKLPRTWFAAGLAIIGDAAYLLTWLIPTFEWPAWTERLSIFMAFGHPYQEWPAWGAIALLVGIAVLGSVAAAAIAERTPKVGTG